MEEKDEGSQETKQNALYHCQEVRLTPRIEKDKEDQG